MRAASPKTCGHIVPFDQAGWTQEHPDHYPALIAGSEIDIVHLLKNRRAG